MKPITIISTFMGISMFMFGFLKLFYPISEWFTIQLSKSGLPAYLFWPGIFSEILVGLTLLLIIIFRKKTSLQALKVMLLLGSLWVIGNMVVAIYVHLQPAVPAYVLPLGIKRPFVPGTFFILAVINMFLTRRLLEENWKLNP